MGNNTSKTEKAAGCGCLIVLLLGVIYAVATMVSGMRGNPVVFLIIIPIFGIFGASIPMSIFSPDKSVRRASGCLCYPVFIIAGIMAFFDNAMSIFWGIVIGIAIIVLLHLIRIGYEEDRKEKDRQIANKFEAALSKQYSDLLPDEYSTNDSKK